MELAPQPVESLSRCPRCDSDFVQPRSWREIGEGRMRLKLRCPECETVMVGTFASELVARYDEQLVEGRRELCDTYETVLRENMALEADVLRRALQLDLVGPEDFAAVSDAERR